MTIKCKEPNMLDAILTFFNKKRAYRIPGRQGPYDYATLQPESFFRALLRPPGAGLPTGYFYRDTLTDENFPINAKEKEVKENESKK